MGINENHTKPKQLDKFLNSFSDYLLIVFRVNSMAEKKEKTSAASEAKKPAKKGFWVSPLPTYIGVLLLLIGLVAGFGIYAVFFPAKTIVQKQPAENLSLSWQWVVHPDCKVCASQSSFELLLAQRKIVSNIETVDATSSKGKELIQKYGIQSFPTAIVSADSFQQTDAGLLTVLKSKLPSALKQGFLVMPEKDLMAETKVYSSYMLAETPPTVACTIPPGKTVLWEFGDNLERATFDALPKVSSLWADFNAELEYDFKHLELYPNSEDAAIIDECSKKVGLFPAYHKLSIERRNTRGRETWNWIEGRNIALEIGLTDENAFKQCVQSKETLPVVQTKTGEHAKLAEAFNVQQVPTFVLDCRFVIIDSKELKKSICLQRPELKACRSA